MKTDKRNMALSFGWVEGVWNMHFGNMFFIIHFLFFLNLHPFVHWWVQTAVSEKKILLSFSLNLSFVQISVILCFYVFADNSIFFNPSFYHV